MVNCPKIGRGQDYDWCMILCFVVLLFYRKAREDEMDASRRLNEMIANYGDVVPRRDFEQLQKQNEVDHILQPYMAE